MPDISIGRFRGGFCVYWWQDGKRRRYQLAARTRAEAEAEGRDKYLRESAPISGLMVRHIWNAYIDHLGKKPTAKTMRYTGKAVLAHFGAFRPEQINDEDCRAYLRNRIAEGRKIGSIHTELGHLRSALRWANKKARLIDHAPHIEMPPKPDSKVEPLSDKQIRDLIDGCVAPHIRLAVILLLTTGGRIGAILDLTWNRVDFERGIIDLRLPDGVTRKGRAVVPMNRMARAALTSAHEARLSEHVVEWSGERIRSIKTGYRAALERAGMTGVNIHQIRHSVAVRMLVAGQSIEAVAQFLGHSNTAITYRTYARFMPEHLADAADVLNFDRFTEPERTSQNRR